MQTTTQDDSAAIDYKVAIKVYHTRFVEDEDDPAFKLARDIRFKPKDVEIDSEVFSEVYEEACAGSLDTRDLTNADGVLENVYRRLQGGRLDQELGYDGSNTRSLMMGDIIAIDGTAYIVRAIGFAKLGALDDLRGGE